MKLENYLTMFGALAVVAVAATGCPGGDDNNPDAGHDAGVDSGTPFPQPANTVPVNFTVNATARPGFYNDEELEWKGGFEYTEATRTIIVDSSWDGPFPPLYDDGPWTNGGHEPSGSVANDDKFGITVFFAKPTESITLPYGAQTNEGGWIWTGPDGAVTIPANPTAEITAAGLTLTPEGPNDLKLTLDKNALGSGHTFASPVRVKGQMSDWTLDPAYDDGTHGDVTSGDGIYTYTLSLNDRRRLKLASALTVEFIWQLGDVEYKVLEGGSAGEGERTGVKAYTKGTADSAFVERTITINSGNKNTQVTIP
jgi:hypothetical protein